MNVVYSSSDSYAPICGTSMYSLLVSNSKCEELNIYLIDNGISSQNKLKMRKMCSAFKRNLSIIPINDIQYKVGKAIDVGRWNISTFARLFYSSILPESVHKVIHIDCDTLITDSLEPMWNYDVSDVVIAGVTELIGDNFKNELGLAIEDNYVNAGNIVLNLEAIRKLDLESEFIKYIGGHSQLSFMDQAVLNACVPNNKILVIPYRYNAYSMPFYVSYKNLKQVKHVTKYCSKEEIDDGISRPAIVHFTSCFMDGTRPWIENNKHPYVNEYLKIRGLSPWGDEALWQDTRKTYKKMANFLARKLPETAVCAVVSVMHNRLIPLKNKMRSRGK